MSSHFSHHTDPRSGDTYVSGLGFVSGNLQNRQESPLDGIRRMSNILCILLLVYFPLREMFLLPATYLAHIVGLDVRINRFTGLIVKSRVSDLTISFLADTLALLIVMLLIQAIYRPALLQAHIFRRPYAGVTGLALPITLAGGVIGTFFSLLLAHVLDLFGLVLPVELAPIPSFSVEVFVSLGAVIAYGCLQEIFFRGVILTPLRKYGDGFAIVASSLLFSLFQTGFVECIAAFLFGVCAAYFVIRSGSIRIALLSRISMTLLLFGGRMVLGMAERSLALVIIMVACLVLLGMAALAYLHFIRADANAFRLVRPQGSHSTRVRLSAFCGSLGFILFAVAILFRIISTIQIIG